MDRKNDGRQRRREQTGDLTYPTKTFWHAGSGRTCTRRVRTDEAQQLTVAEVKAQLPGIAHELERRVLYVNEHLDDGGVSLQVALTPPGRSLTFEVAHQRRGRRHWFCCVRCARRAGKLYRVALPAGVVWGCQRCLGLAYPSQAQHKTRARDLAITEERVEASERERVEASVREGERRRKTWLGFAGRLRRR